MRISLLGQSRLSSQQRQERLLDLALERALVGQEQVLGELLGDRGAALHHVAGLGIGDERAQRAGDVDAEMLVEAPILGGEHRLDQRVGELVERDRVVMADAALADLVAVAVEEGHRQFRLLQPVVVGGLVEGGGGQRQHQDQPGGAQRSEFGRDLGRPAPPAGDVEAVHEGGEALVALARALSPAEQAEVEPAVEAEQQLLQVGLPVLGKQVAQGFSLWRTAAKAAATQRRRQFSRSGRGRPCRRGGKRRQGEREMRGNGGGRIPVVFRERSPASVFNV